MEPERRLNVPAAKNEEAGTEFQGNVQSGGEAVSLPLIRRNVPLAGSKLDHFIGVLFLPKEIAQVSDSLYLTENDLLMLHESGIRWR